MRILHISDLHFGKHNQPLAESLLRRIEGLKVDAIVCTGDIADGPDSKLWNSAKQFLRQAQEKCTGKASPSLIVLPGNHDYQWLGSASSFLADSYDREWQGYNTEGFYKLGKVNVWVFGFNSGEKGELGGAGRIKEEEIVRFQKRYDELAKDPDFAGAFKIVGVHHHPLPVNWSRDFKAKWLTMVNSGQFLSPMLFRKIDLILHGHEHLQARASFWSTLGDNHHKVSVVSLGATLREMDNPKLNWFGLVTIEEKRAAVAFHYNVGFEWSEEPDRAQLVVRSEGETEQRNWEQQVADAGYFYREVASIAVLDEDGDAKRIVECGNLTIQNPANLRAKKHVVKLAPTSGYLASLTAKGKKGLNVLVEKRIPWKEQDHQSWESPLKFQPPIQGGDEHAGSYQYSWYAVNSFALDGLQFEQKYDRENTPLWNIEFTHYPVVDPIEYLTVIVQFPPGFRGTEPRLRVVQIDPEQPDSRKWETNSEAYEQLDAGNALRFYESLRSAALRVRHPRQGLSYGIEWEVPEAQAGLDESISGEARQLWNIWRAPGKVNEDQRKGVVATICRAFSMTRKVLLQGWAGDLVGDFMYRDADSKLPMLTGVRETKIINGTYEQVALTYNTQLRYGTGIGGRAFKTNSVRVYEKPDRVNPDNPPLYYRPALGGPEHEVLASFPVHVPVDDDVWETNAKKKHDIYNQMRPYGILNIGSERADCPLVRNLRSWEVAVRVPKFRHHLNQLLFESFKSIFL